jgi:hypothetical protein
VGEHFSPQQRQNNEEMPTRSEAERPPDGRRRSGGRPADCCSDTGRRERGAEAGRLLQRYQEEGAGRGGRESSGGFAAAHVHAAGNFPPFRWWRRRVRRPSWLPSGVAAAWAGSGGARLGREMALDGSADPARLHQAESHRPTALREVVWPGERKIITRVKTKRGLLTSWSNNRYSVFVNVKSWVRLKSGRVAGDKMVNLGYVSYR